MAPDAGRAFALVLVDELVRRGVRHAVVAPGSRSTPVALALLEHPGVEVHVRVDERSAAYLALGIAKAGGRVVPVLCTSGTAASYFHGAALEADLARVPLLLLTADRPPELHGVGANQTVEQAGMYGAVVRWAPDVPVPEAVAGSVERWRDLAATAVAHCLGATGQPPGPVHLNLPLREPLVPTESAVAFPEDLGLDAAASEQSVRSCVASGGGDELAGQLADARVGVVVAGGGAGREATTLAAAAGWPLIAEPHSNCRRGPQALRATDVMLRDASFVAAHRPDLVVVFGRVGLSRALLSWLAQVPHVVLTDGGHWDVTGSARAVLTCAEEDVAAAARAVSPAPEEWLADWQAASRRAARDIDRLLDAQPRLTEPAVARDVAALLPAGACLVVASSMPIRDLDLVMAPRDDLTVYSNRGVSGIDGFVSTAQGVALARRAVGPTVALGGDLSLLHDVNGLMPGPDPRPDVTYVVVNNDGGGIFSLLPQATAVAPAPFERLFGTPHRMSLERLAAAYEVEHTMASTTAELATGLTSYGGVRLIEVRTDRAENAALHERLREISVSTA